MKRVRLTVFCKGLEVNSDIQDLTDVEYNGLVKEVEKAQSGQTDSLTIKANNAVYFVPRKQLKRSVIILRDLDAVFNQYEK